MDEYAIEEALTLKEAHGGEVTVLTVGPDSAADAIRKALSTSADEAVHVTDDAIHGRARRRPRRSSRRPCSSRSSTSCCAARSPPTGISR